MSYAYELGEELDWGYNLWGFTNGDVVNTHFPFVSFGLRENAANYVRFMSTRYRLPANWELV